LRNDRHLSLRRLTPTDELSKPPLLVLPLRKLRSVRTLQAEVSFRDRGKSPARTMRRIYSFLEGIRQLDWKLIVCALPKCKRTGRLVLQAREVRGDAGWIQAVADLRKAAATLMRLPDGAEQEV
jgi:hypothetical protein